MPWPYRVKGSNSFTNHSFCNVATGEPPIPKGFTRHIGAPRGILAQQSLHVRSLRNENEMIGSRRTSTAPPVRNGYAHRSIAGSILHAKYVGQWKMDDVDQARIEISNPPGMPTKNRTDMLSRRHIARPLQCAAFRYNATYPASISSNDPLTRFSHFSPAAFHTRTECTPSSA